MSGLDIFALFVLFVLLATAVGAWVFLAMLPGKIAKSRNHPQSDAINIGGWLGALFGGVMWPIILIWAFMRPTGVSQGESPSSEEKELSQRIDALEAKLVSGRRKRT